MTDRDFDQTDGRVLAEFCDFEKRTYEDQNGVDYFKDGETRKW